MSQLDHTASVRRLAALFRADQHTRPILLLGAGASFRSGVPLADTLVVQIMRLAYAVDKYGDESAISRVTVSDWKPLLEAQSWFIPGENRRADNYPFAAHEFLRPQSRRRKFFLDAINMAKGPSQGYRDLADLMRRRLCWTVLTTNFDPLLYQALLPLQARFREIVEINRAEGDLDQFSVYNQSQIVYVHGAVELYRDRNLPEETQRLDTRLVSKLWPLLAEAPLIVAGYRGAEPSVVEHLLGGGIKACDHFRHGIYWCQRGLEEPHPNVVALRNKLGPNFQLLPITGFDELLADLNTELTGEALVVTEQRAANTTSTLWDAQPVEGASLDELDLELGLVLLQRYSERLKLPAVDSSNREGLLLDLRLVVRQGVTLVPTNGGLLLLGKNPQARFPHAVVALTTKQKSRQVFDGNLIQQFEALLKRLSDPTVNPVLRLKSDTSSEDRTAYPTRALTELLANLLVHRDYESDAFAEVEHQPGVHLQFSNPGGLLPRIRAKLKPDTDGRFSPVRGESELRNPTLADLFFGYGPLDKEGTGLPDVRELMPLHGGSADFACAPDNGSLAITLLQAVQQTTRINVALRRPVETEVFTTNLLPFKVVPSKVYFLPRSDGDNDRVSFASKEEIAQTGICISQGATIISFADFARMPGFANRVGDLSLVTSTSLAQFLAKQDNNNLFIRLVGKHWRFHLRNFRGDGIYEDSERKRAYFRVPCGVSGRLYYRSRLNRRIFREPVKVRGTEERPEHENEGFYWRIEQMSGVWAIQVKPTYVFTGRDGRTPLPPSYQTSRATRRFKFDRNKMVEDDLTFWARYLGGGNTMINLGKGYGDDLVLGTEYASAEVPLPPEKGSP